MEGNHQSGSCKQGCPIGRLRCAVTKVTLALHLGHFCGRAEAAWTIYGVTQQIRGRFRPGRSLTGGRLVAGAVNRSDGGGRYSSR